MGYTQYLRTGGGTAIRAGVLAILGGLLHLFAAAAAIIVILNGGTEIFLVIFAGLCAAVAGCLVTGGIELFLKKQAGRLSTIIGCGLALLLCAIGGTYVLVSGRVSFIESSENGFLGINGWVTLVLLAIPPIVTLVLTLVKPTARWVGQAGPAVPPAPAGNPAQG
jgi:hypothetical protein